MGKHIPSWSLAGVSVLAFTIVGCQKPQLRSDRSKGSEEEAEQVADREGGKGYRAIREEVIGRTFDTLTLGSRQFADAEVRDITDEVIVVAHSGGVDEVPWREVPGEVRERWGYDPSAGSLVDGGRQEPAESDDASRDTGAGRAKSPEESAGREAEMSLEERAEEIARREKRMESQLEGMRRIESELARHSNRLATLRRKLRSIRAKQSSRRSGGVRVERVGGKSTVVNREKEVREVKKKIEVKQQLVEQLSRSLEGARKEYRKLRRSVDRLRE